MKRLVTKEAVGARIKQRRKEKGLTQAKLAKAIRERQNYVSRYENNRIPSPETLVKIARLLGVSIDWILTGEEAPCDHSTPEKVA